MVVFEWVVALLLGALVLAALARRLGIPYPTLLALGGAALALVPGTPQLRLDPQLALALFVAPVLLDAAFDSSPRDLRAHGATVAGLVVAAVGVTVVAVALVAHTLLPSLPWPAAIALGAIVAPPDAAAAMAVLRQVRPPHRILTILEGESLLNDATALVVYRMAVDAALDDHADLGMGLAGGALGIAASLVLGPLVAWLASAVHLRIEDVATSIIAQFVTTFAVWMLAERLHLSAVLTIVSYAIAIGRWSPARMPARLRVPSFAVWDTAIFLLNVLAFVLVGLQVGPIVERLDPTKHDAHLLFASAVVVTVIVARFAWVMGYDTLLRARARRASAQAANATAPMSVRGDVLVSWCGMRGIVTLAAALALPPRFPERDLLVLTAFAVVLGTLVLQGLTLPWLLRTLHLRDDDPVGREVHEARSAAYRAALTALDGDESSASHALRLELHDALRHLELATDRATPVAALRRRAAQAAREKVLALRSEGVIGDAAFQRVEEELDAIELTT